MEEGKAERERERAGGKANLLGGGNEVQDQHAHTRKRQQTVPVVYFHVFSELVSPNAALSLTSFFRRGLYLSICRSPLPH